MTSFSDKTLGPHKYNRHAASYQAIVTKYLGPTNYRPGRIKAKAAAKSVTVEYDHGLSQSGNHALAACALAEQMGWGGRWFRGSHPDGNGDVFVCVPLPGLEANDAEPVFVTPQRG